MLWQAISAVRDVGRLHDIASILIRYGFGDIVRRMGLANALERAGRALHWNEAEELAHLEPPARVRRALEELGPTFVKLGQVLATRIDLFDPDFGEVAVGFGIDQRPAEDVPAVLRDVEDLAFDRGLEHAGHRCLSDALDRALREGALHRVAHRGFVAAGSRYRGRRRDDHQQTLHHGPVLQPRGIGTQ